MRAPIPRSTDLWADENRVLPRGSAEPGKFRSSRNPYMIPIARAFGNPLVRRIIFIMGSQMGKSITMQNIIGHRLDDDPAPIIYVGPTQSNIDNVVEPKVVEMFKGCKSLWDKLAKGQKSTKHHKRISGVSLRFAWAGSATELASDSAALGLVDEVDRMEEDVKGEGSPVELTEARTSIYPDGKIGVTSTPTEGNVDVVVDSDSGLERWDIVDSGAIVSTVWKLWQEGSRHEWSVPCPHCHQYFIPRFRHLKWPEKSTKEEAESGAFLACPNNGCVIENKHRRWMNKNGVFIAPGQRPADLPKEEATGIDIIDHKSGAIDYVEFGEYVHTSNSNQSFWVSGIMSFSSKKTFGFLAGKYVSAVRSGDPERIQGVINTDFGELYRISGDAPEWTAVKNNAYPNAPHQYALGEVYDEVDYLFAGVDVQKNQLYYVVRGFGAGQTSWLVERGEIWGDTLQDDVWKQLGDLLGSKWGNLGISDMVVDSGYRPQKVYAFARENRSKVKAYKGHLTLDRPFYASDVDVTIRGRIFKGGVKLWHFNSDILKSWVHAKVEWPHDQSGGWYLPEDIDDDYCRQIVNEQRAVKPSGGIAWIKTGPNHYLDSEALAFAAMVSSAKKLKFGTRKRPEEPEGKQAPRKQVVKSEKAEKKPSFFRRDRRESWMKRH